MKKIIKQSSDEALLLVFRLVKTLKPPENRIIELYLGSGENMKSACTVHEIAEIMKLDIKTTRKIVKRGIKHLIKMIRAIKKKKNYR